MLLSACLTTVAAELGTMNGSNSSWGKLGTMNGTDSSWSNSSTPDHSDSLAFADACVLYFAGSSIFCVLFFCSLCPHNVITLGTSKCLSLFVRYCQASITPSNGGVSPTCLAETISV